MTTGNFIHNLIGKQATILKYGGWSNYRVLVVWDWGECDWLWSNNVIFENEPFLVLGFDEYLNCFKILKSNGFVGLLEIDNNFDVVQIAN